MSVRLLEPAELTHLIGKELGVSRWFTVDQACIESFAEVTHDKQWIHVDVERAARESVGTIAHGFLTLSLMSSLVADIWAIRGTARAFNYGFNKVRFPTAVQSGARVRLRETLLDVVTKPDGLLLTRESRIEIEGLERPAVVAEWIVYVVIEAGSTTDTPAT